MLVISVAVSVIPTVGSLRSLKVLLMKSRLGSRIFKQIHENCLGSGKDSLVTNSGGERDLKLNEWKK